MDRKILSIDTVARMFKTLTVNSVSQASGLTMLDYDDCIEPIVITDEQYKDLLNGHIIELHAGEIAIQLIEDN